MLSVTKSLPDGIARRELLRVGGLSLFGMSLPQILQAAEQSRGPGRIKSVILFNLLGGPSHQDMFDMKPDAAVEVRGEFQPIDTSLPGLQICELMPNVAKLMHKASLIRTVSHQMNTHDPLPIMTGYDLKDPKLQAEPTDPPDIGAVCQYVGLGPSDVPGSVCLPCFPGWGQNGYRRGGPYGGFLGSQYDPMFSFCSPTFDREPKFEHYDPVMPMGEPYLPGLDQLAEVNLDRLNGRRSLLQAFDDDFRSVHDTASQDRLDKFQRRAFSMLTGSKVRNAFDLSLEKETTRDDYGRNLFGSSLLVARRLVEVGVPFISVHQEIFKHYGHAYDMHVNNFNMLRNVNFPVLDRAYPALITDLEQRGLLDSTLVIVMGEMGRSPRVNSAAGRDHWPQCGFSLLTGGGIKQGNVYGATDKIAAYPISNKVHPADLVATVYHLLGIDPHLIVHDRLGRPHEIARGGEPIAGVLA